LTGCTIFQAELFTLREAVSSLENTTTQSKVYTDSRSSLEAIRDTLTRHEDARTVRRALLKNPNIQLNWVRGHVGEKGNEEADRLAKAATLSRTILLEKKIPAATAKRIIKIHILGEWQKFWDHPATHGKLIHRVLPKIQWRERSWSREKTIFFSGHGPFPTHFLRFGISNNDKCLCGGVGSPLHYATECEKTSDFHLVKPLPQLEHEWFKRMERDGKAMETIKDLVKFLEANQEHLHTKRDETIQTPHETQQLRRSERLRARAEAEDSVDRVLSQEIEELEDEEYDTEGEQSEREEAVEIWEDSDSDFK
jgi:hypothetical protein